MSKKAQESASSGTSGGRRHRHAHDLLKTEICVFYMKGCCPRGNRCGFAHGNEDLRSVPLEERSRKGLIPSVKRFKSDICEKWLTTGICPYGDRCCFLHDSRIGISLRELLETAKIEIFRDAHPAATKSGNRSVASSRSISLEPQSRSEPDDGTLQGSLGTLQTPVDKSNSESRGSPPRDWQETLAAHKPTFPTHPDVHSDSSSFSAYLSPSALHCRMELSPHDVHSPTVMNPSSNAMTPVSTISNPSALAASNSPAHLRFLRVESGVESWMGQESAIDYTQVASPNQTIELKPISMSYNSPPLTRRLSFSSSFVNSKDSFSTPTNGIQETSCGATGGETFRPNHPWDLDNDISARSHVTSSICHANVSHHSSKSSPTYPLLNVSNTMHNPYSVSELSDLESTAHTPLHNLCPNSASKVSPVPAGAASVLTTPPRRSRADSSPSPASTPGTPATPGTTHSLRSFVTTASSMSGQKKQDTSGSPVAEAAITVAVPQALTTVPKLHAARQLLALTTGIAMSSKSKVTPTPVKDAGNSSASNSHSNVHSARSHSHSPSPASGSHSCGLAMEVHALPTPATSIPSTKATSATMPSPTPYPGLLMSGPQTLPAIASNDRKSGARILLNANGNLITEPLFRSMEIENTKLDHLNCDSPEEEDMATDVTGLIAQASALMALQQGSESASSSSQPEVETNVAVYPSVEKQGNPKAASNSTVCVSPATSAHDGSNAQADDIEEKPVEDEWNPQTAQCASKDLFPGTWRTFVATLGELEKWRANGCGTPSPTIAINTLSYQQITTKTVEEQRQWFQLRTRTTAFSETPFVIPYLCTQLFDAAFAKLQQMFFAPYKLSSPPLPSHFSLHNLTSNSFYPASNAPSGVENLTAFSNHHLDTSLTDTILILLESYKSLSANGTASDNGKTVKSGGSNAMKQLSSTHTHGNSGPSHSISSNCTDKNKNDIDVQSNACTCASYRSNKNDPQFSRLPVLMLLSMGVDLAHPSEQKHSSVQGIIPESVLPRYSPTQHLTTPVPMLPTLDRTKSHIPSSYTPHPIPLVHPSQAIIFDGGVSSQLDLSSINNAANTTHSVKREHSSIQQHWEQPSIGIPPHNYDGFAVANYHTQSWIKTLGTHSIQGAYGAMTNASESINQSYPNRIHSNNPLTPAHFISAYGRAPDRTSNENPAIRHIYLSHYASNIQSGQDANGVRELNHPDNANGIYSMQQNALAKRDELHRLNTGSINHSYTNARGFANPMSFSPESGIALWPSLQMLATPQLSQSIDPRHGGEPWITSPRYTRYYAEREIDMLKDSTFYPSLEHAMQRS